MLFNLLSTITGWPMNGTYQESCLLGVLELCTFKQLTSICALGSS
jgi:hypothetical protein